jgi:hypothetical protein
MDSYKKLEMLEQEMKQSDRVSDKRLLLYVLGVLFVSVGLLALLFFTLENPQPYLVPVVLLPIFGVSQGLLHVQSQKRRSKIFEKYGFKCQSCNKTPYSIRLLNSTSKEFCPFCQLKYFP